LSSAYIFQRKANLVLGHLWPKTKNKKQKTKKQNKTKKKKEKKTVPRMGTKIVAIW